MKHRHRQYKTHIRAPDTTQVKMDTNINTYTRHDTGKDGHKHKHVHQTRHNSDTNFFA